MHLSIPTTPKSHLIDNLLKENKEVSIKACDRIVKSNGYLPEGLLPKKPSK